MMKTKEKNPIETEKHAERIGEKPVEKKSEDKLGDTLAEIRRETKTLKEALRKLRDILNVKADSARDYDASQKRFNDQYSILDEKQVEETGKELPDHSKRLGVLRESYLKVAQAKLAEIKDLDVDSGGGLSGLGSLLDDFRRAASAAAANLEGVSSLDSRVWALEKIHQKNKLDEGNFSSFEDAWRKKRELESERLSYRRKWFGRWKHKEEIKALDRQIEPVDKVLDVEFHTEWTRRHSELRNDFRHYSEGDRIRKMQEEVKEAVLEKVFGKLNKMSEEFLSGGKRESHVEMGDEIVSGLNDDYIETFVKSEIEKKKEELRQGVGAGAYYDPRNQEQLDKLEDEKQVSRLLGQLKKSFGMNRGDVWSSDKTEREKAEIKETLDELNNLSSPFGMIRYSVNFNSGKMDDLFSKMADFTASAPGILVSRELAESLAGLKGELSGFMYTWDYEKYYGEDLRTAEARGRKEMEKMNEFDIRRWKIMRKSEEVRRILGAENIDNVDKFLANKLVDDMVYNARAESSAWDRMYEFLPYRFENRLPELILCAFREKGHHHNFLMRAGANSEKNLSSMVSQLSAADIEDLGMKEIPGLAGLIDLIRQNPETYWVRSSTYFDEETRRTVEETNPINKEVERELMRMCEHFLDQKSAGRKNLALGVIRNLDVAPSKRIVEVLMDQARQEAGGIPQLFWECAEHRILYRNDPSLFKAFAEDERILSGGVLEKIKEKIPSLMKIYLKEKDGDPNSIGGIISKALGKSPEELQDLKNRVKDFGNKYKDDLLTYYDPYRIYGDNDSDFTYELEPSEVFPHVAGCYTALLKVFEISKEGKVETGKLTAGILNYLNIYSRRTGGMTREENRIEPTKEDYRKFDEFLRKLASQIFSENGIFKNNEGVVAQEYFLKLFVRDPKRRKLLLQIGELSPSLLTKENTPLFNYFIGKFDVLAKDETDVKFINAIIGRHGKISHQIVMDYVRCLESGIITRNDRQTVLDFTERFRILSPELMKEYLNAKKYGNQEIFISHLNSLTEKMISSEGIPEEERGQGFYQDLLREVYPNNSENWTSYENNRSCADRSSDLETFKTKPRYEIDLMSAAEIEVKKGESLDSAGIAKMKENVMEYSRIMESFGYDSEKANEYLSRELDECLKEAKATGGISGAEFDSNLNVTEKLYIAMMDHMYGTRGISLEKIKKLMVIYEFSNFEDVREYIQGTSDRVSHSSNPDYALLCELNTFYSDRIKEVSRHVVESAHENEFLVRLSESYFQNFSKKRRLEQKENIANQSQIGKLGLTEEFLKQIGKTLKGKTGRTYTKDQLRRIVRLYEGISRGLPEKSSTSEKGRARAFYGQLKAQRDKTLQAVKRLAGAEIDPREIHLEEINLDDLIKTEENIEADNYDEKQFANFTVQKLIGIFGEEQGFTERELDKFESVSGFEREVLHAYITKTKESANARMVGGVCVSGDNPQKSGETCMWNMKNFMQVVFQHPENQRCQGLVMMHHFSDENGERTLAVSLNPSSTYVYSVDEKALLRGIMGALADFAEDNGFGRIVISQNKAIRTNRTGGVFEREMDKLISEIGETYRFEEPQVFSYKPSYNIQDMDVVWKRK